MAQSNFNDYDTHLSHFPSGVGASCSTILYSYARDGKVWQAEVGNAKDPQHRNHQRSRCALNALD